MDAVVSEQTLNNQKINLATDSIFMPLQNGNYWVLIKDSLGCIYKSCPINMLLSNVESFSNSNHLQIYPNPFMESVYIKSLDICSNYIICDRFGQTLLKGCLYNGENTIELGALRSGVYVIKIINTDGKVMCSKLIKSSI